MIPQNAKIQAAFTAPTETNKETTLAGRIVVFIAYITTAASTLTSRHFMW